MKRNFLKIVTSLFLMLITSTVFTMTLGIPIVVPFVAMLAAGAVKHFVSPGTEMSQLNLYDGFVIADQTYAGEAATRFIVKSLTQNETVSGGHIYIKDGIKKKFTIPRWDIDFELFIQDTAPTPTQNPLATQNVTGQILDPADYTIYHEFDPSDYEDHWFATQMNSKLIDAALPVTANSVLIQEVLKRHGKYVNKAIWNSSTLLTNAFKYYEGLKRRCTLSANGTIIAVGAPIVLTNVNVAAEFLRGFLLCPDALRYETTTKLFCNYNTYEMYMQYQVNQTNKGDDISKSGNPFFRGMPVVRIADIPDNMYVIAKGTATPESNIWMGVNSVNDAEVQLEKLQANSKKYFLKVLMKADVNFGWNEEVVYYQG